jgi:hypothetical protein
MIFVLSFQLSVLENILLFILPLSATEKCHRYFRNQQLSRRVNILQEEIDAHQVMYGAVNKLFVIVG